MDEWDLAKDDLPFDDNHVAGLKGRKQIADEFLDSLERESAVTLTDPAGFQALRNLVDLDVPRMLREILQQRK